jgi:thioesterase domain-containing protein/acyl carrier protein
MDHDTRLSGNVPPIGYPVDEMEVVLLDDERKPVETGETGEIAVRSRYLSPGYWNMNDLTARAFLPDPIDGKCRIYLTGDLGRMKQDGCLEHLGRKDSQVKIRGFRTELQEIEALLDQHQGILENFVTTTIDDHGENRLVAYVVPKAGQALSQSELRAFLKEKLPDHMVPSIVQFMDVLPRTPNGKVDRQSLPRTVKRHRVLEQAAVPPKDGLELELSTIWEHVLDIQPVGVDDNFFDLGGHSLQAVRIIGAIERRLGKKLAPAVLFQAPTVKQLASLLREARWNTAQPSILPLQTAGYNRPLYWIHGDSTNAFLPDFLGTDQPLYGLEHQSQDGVPAVYTTVESIATYYLNQILTLQPQGPYRLGGYSFGGTVAFEIAQRLARQKQEVVLLFMLDSLFPQSAAISDTASSSAVRAITPYMRIAQEQLRHLSRLKTHEKLTYIVMKVASKLRDRAAVPVRKAARIFKTAACRYHLWKKHGIPPSLRSFYILKIYQRALRNYSPQRYDGHAIYIKSSERSRQNAQDWAGVIAGGLEVYEVPGDHMTIIKQPIARLWAEKLKSHLARIDVVT